MDIYNKKTFIRNKIITEFTRSTYLSNGFVISKEHNEINYSVWKKDKNGEIPYKVVEENSKLGYYALLKKYMGEKYE